MTRLSWPQYNDLKTTSFDCNIFFFQYTKQTTSAWVIELPKLKFKLGYFNFKPSVNCDGVMLQWCCVAMVPCPSGLSNYFIYKRFTVQTFSWSLEFVIWINLQHGTIVKFKLLLILIPNPFSIANVTIKPNRLQYWTEPLKLTESEDIFKELVNVFELHYFQLCYKFTWILTNLNCFQSEVLITLALG